MSARFRRVAEKGRNSCALTVDGAAVEALEGDTILTVLMMSRGFARLSEFGDGRRAGFCMMGACQDCWVWTDSGDRLRACSTPVTTGMAILTQAPEGLWPIPA